MAQLAAALPVILTATGSIISGIQARRAGDAEANAYEVAAGQATAASHRTAAEETRKARLLQSRAQAVAAASGAGASDPTVADIIGDIAGEGQYRSMLAIYEGEEKARALRGRGEAVRREGRSRQTASIINAGKSLFEKYGGASRPGDIDWGKESGLG